jgi:zinc protease
MKKLTCAVAAAAVVSTLALFVPPAAAKDVAIPFVKYQLPNGLTVILHEDHSFPTVAVNLWYRVGSKDESPGRTGFAHLFEHLMFTGSKHVPGNMIDLLMEGAGGWNNASTAPDRTNYFDVGPSNLLESLLWIEADRLATLDDATTDKELGLQRDVVRNERRQSYENRPYGRAHLVIPDEMYPASHPYHWPVIGSHRDLEAASIADVQSFFRRFYVPSNASLVVAGDFAPAQARQWIERYFGWIPTAPAPTHAAAAPITLPQPKARTITDRVQLPQIRYVYHSPAAYQPGDAELDLLAQILATGKTSRLYKRLVYELRIAQEVSAAQESQRLGSLFQISVTAKPGHSLAAIERVLDAEISHLLQEPPTQRELEQARNRVVTSFFVGLEQLASRADQLNQYEFSYGDPGAIRKDLARYREATTASVHRVAAQVLRPGARFTLRIEPGQLPEPERPAARLPSAGTKPLPPRATSGPDYLAKPPVRKAVPPFKVPTPVVLKLRNGLPVIVLERHGLPIVSFALVVRAGAELDPATQPGLADLAAEMLDEGAGSRSALEIADAVAHLGATLETGANHDGSQVTMSVLREHLPTALDIFADVARRPRFEEREWTRVQNDRLTQLLKRRDDPAQVAHLVYDRVLYGDGHPYGRSVLGTEAAVKALTTTDLKRFYETWYGPRNAAILVVGDVTGPEIRRLLEARFGDWQAAPAARTATRPVLTVPAAPLPRVTIVDRRAAEQSMVLLGRPGTTRNDPDYATLMVMNTILGDAFTSRLNQNLRERKGYTYGASSAFDLRRGRGPFWASAAVKTEVTEDSVRQFLLEFDRLGKEPIPTDELRKAQTIVGRSLPELHQRNAAVVHLLADLWVHELPPGYYAQYEKRVRAVTAADVQRVARKYASGDGAAIVIVGERKRIEPQLEKLGLKNPAVRDADGALKP